MSYFDLLGLDSSLPGGPQGFTWNDLEKEREYNNKLLGGNFLNFLAEIGKIAIFIDDITLGNFDNITDFSQVWGMKYHLV